MTKLYRANGKLLLTAEYTILDGAIGLGLPTKKGQILEIIPCSNKQLHWQSFDHHMNMWYENSFEIRTSKIIPNKLKEDPVTQRLVQIFNTCLEISPELVKKLIGHKCRTILEFDKSWGLGSSSTLISLISQWTKTNPYDLLMKSFGGSGYDIACANNNQPILYRKIKNTPEVTPTAFNPAFRNDLYFVYLNQKQNSRIGIKQYNSIKRDKKEFIQQINTITKAILSCNDLISFKSLINEHEAIIAKCTNQKTVKERLFNDFNGALKSLGAWGGDFILAATETDPTSYFKNKGLNTVIPYNDMILS